MPAVRMKKYPRHRKLDATPRRPRPSPTTRRGAIMGQHFYSRGDVAAAARLIDAML